MTSITFELPTMDTLVAWTTWPHKDWEWFYHLTYHMLYQHAFNTWHHYVPSSQHATQHQTFHCLSLVNIPPASLHCVMAWIDDLGCAHFEGTAIDTLPTPPPTLTIPLGSSGSRQDWMASHDGRQDFKTVAKNPRRALPINQLPLVYKDMGSGPYCQPTLNDPLSMDAP